MEHRSTQPTHGPTHGPTRRALARILAALALSAALATPGAAPAAGPAQPACYADFKAKRNRPLQLQYGVIALNAPACASPKAAADVIAARIAVDGWILLRVLSIFDARGLAQRKASAGKYFLRY